MALGTHSSSFQTKLTCVHFVRHQTNWTGAPIGMCSSEFGGAIVWEELETWFYIADRAIIHNTDRSMGVNNEKLFVPFSCDALGQHLKVTQTQHPLCVSMCWVDKKKVKSGDIYGIQENIDGLVGDVPLNMKPKTWTKRLLTLTLCLTRLSSEHKGRHCFNGKISFLHLRYWNHRFIRRTSNKGEIILRSECNEGERKVDSWCQFNVEPGTAQRSHKCQWENSESRLGTNADVHV